MIYNLLCPINGPGCKDRWFDPCGSLDGFIDVKRCPPCDDGKNPESRSDRLKYLHNRNSKIARGQIKPRRGR